MLVLWCPDWPVAAAARGANPPGSEGEAQAAAVLSRGVVLACSEAARAKGVHRGQRRRQAQASCPQLEVFDHDPAHEARAFEPVVAAVEAFTPCVEILRPGVCALPTRGPARYFGGEASLAARIVEAVDAVAPGCRTGVAEGRFAAVQAARRGLIVPCGQTPAFLAPLPVATLGEDLADLADLLGRLGVRTLGDLAALPARAVVARFGPRGAQARRLARGLDEIPLAARRPPPDLAVETVFDPPADRTDVAAFAARGLADELTCSLASRGLVAARVAVEAESEWEEQRRRLWRLEGAAGNSLAQRVRWQLEAWLTEGSLGPLARLRLVPDEVRPDRGRQEGFWGGDREASGRAGAAVARIQGRWGPEAATQAVAAGGRGPGEQFRLVPWGDADAVDRVPARGGSAGERPPWPGRLPSPAPATVLPVLAAAEVVDPGGGPLGVTGRGLPTGSPGRLSIEGGPWRDVVAWAGPWLADERWWDRLNHRRRARWQLVTVDGDAHLLVLEGGRWWLEASYD